MRDFRRRRWNNVRERNLTEKWIESHGETKLHKQTHKPKPTRRKYGKRKLIKRRTKLDNRVSPGGLWDMVFTLVGLEPDSSPRERPAFHFLRLGSCSYAEGGGSQVARYTWGPPSPRVTGGRKHRDNAVQRTSESSTTYEKSLDFHWLGQWFPTFLYLHC